MSAIIAGMECEKCHNPYYESFGHPWWWEEEGENGLPENKIYEKYREVCDSRMCLSCYSEIDEEGIRLLESNI